MYRWVQDEGGDWGWSMWAICGKKAQHFSMKVCYSFFQAEILLTWPVLMKFNCMLDREISEYLL